MIIESVRKALAPRRRRLSVPTATPPSGGKKAPKRREPSEGYEPFAEEAWGNEPYGNNEPYEPYEPYGGKHTKQQDESDESKNAERSEARGSDERKKRRAERGERK